MSDTDDARSDDRLTEIRRRKREQLQDRLRGGDEPIHVADGDQFAAVTEQYPVVLVDFYADWCGPCKMLEPTVERLAAETTAAVAKVDIDANQALASQYGVRSVPTLLLFSDGEVAERVVGVQDESRLRSLIARYAE